ncbi:hypothetical protein A0H81_11414 [Grifola frondosa]|uniref:Uncharacterized protein n=1 Tax=Grifola frondosa TaxID=5627 RepID=A0A1C7LX06_GRIFR|nr:hypothetical protein A0H81_13059 [Grifola frondosa]OBZ68647.1 hypothetical protein A0H81_11414 [Grifola frondosa]
MFLLGLVDPPWNRHHAVAVVATVLVTVLLLFSAFTIILPSFSRDCFYKSLEALGFFLLMQEVLRPGVELDRTVAGLSHQTLLLSRLLSASGYTKRPSDRHTIVGGNKRVCSERVVSPRMAHPVCMRCVKMDDDFLKHTIEPCFCTVAIEIIVPCYDDILRHRADDLGELRQTWTHNRSVKSVNATLSLPLCALEKLNTGDQKYHEDQLCILRRLDTLWGSIGDYEVEYSATARLLGGTAEMFLNQFNRRCREVCNIFPSSRRSCAMVRSIFCLTAT